MKLKIEIMRTVFTLSLSATLYSSMIACIVFGLDTTSLGT